MRLAKTFLATMTAVMLMAAPSFAIDLGQRAGFLPVRAEAAAPGGATGLCSAYDWACAPGNGRAVGADVVELAVKVNRSANRAIHPVSDQAQYATEEVWTLPTATGGDCEDYVLFKKHELIKAGVNPDRLLIATVLDRKGNSHAVLVLRADAGDLVLDNMTNSVKSWEKTGYTFLQMQNPNQPTSWVATLAGGMLQQNG